MYTVIIGAILGAIFLPLSMLQKGQGWVAKTFVVILGVPFGAFCGAILFCLIAMGIGGFIAPKHWEPDERLPLVKLGQNRNDAIYVVRGHKDDETVDPDKLANNFLILAQGQKCKIAFSFKTDEVKRQFTKQPIPELIIEKEVLDGFWGKVAITTDKRYTISAPASAWGN